MSSDQKELIVGLDGSLRMMEKASVSTGRTSNVQVLNDVLSFNRMESGNLLQARKPFNIHQAVHYVALSHRATAELSGLNLELELDSRIDEIGGTVVGDEMRFKQVCSNLVSNAFKFTASGGVKVVTKLLLPVLPEPEVAPRVELLGLPEHGDPNSVASPGTTVVGTVGTTGTVATLTLDDNGKPDSSVEEDHGSVTVLLSGQPTGPISAKSATSSKQVSLEEKARLSFDFADPDRPNIQVGTSPLVPSGHIPEPSSAPLSLCPSLRARCAAKGPNSCRSP
jgi:hypothetical protein